MDKLNLKVPPVVVFLACVLLLWVTNNYLPELLIIDVPKWITTVPIIIGVFVALAGVLQFALQSTTVNPHKPDHATRLVTGGIYKFTRNPMYLGLLLILFAGVLRFGDLLGLLVLAFFVLYMNRFQIKPEEEVMENKFGDEYQKYKDNVRRWI